MEPDPPLGGPARARKSKQRATISQESKEEAKKQCILRGDSWSEGDKAMASTRDGDALPFLLDYI